VETLAKPLTIKSTRVKVKLWVKTVLCLW